MDLALGFAPPARRNSKMVLPLPSFRSKSFDESVSIHIPMGSDQPNIFSSPGTCRFTRFAMGPQYDSPNCNYLQKSAQFGRSSSGLQKIIMPKETSLGISISRQTIVGGFVGSKTYAGRSMFGDSSQIWDAIICKFVELMSLVKDKPASPEPRNKMPSTASENYVSSNESHAWKNKASNDSVGSSKCVPCPSSNECVPRNIIVSNSTETSNKVSNDNIPLVCKAVVPECEGLAPNPSAEIFPHHKGTYSSVVDGSFKNECASSGPCTMAKSNEKCQLPEDSLSCVQRVPFQSYADVAKIIPSKPIPPPNKIGCQIPQNSRSMWICIEKRKKKPLNRNYLNRQERDNRNIAMGDFLTCGDTRWKGDWKSKREKFQRKCPEVASSNVYSSSSTETSEDSCAKSSCIKDSETDSDVECKRVADEREPTRPGCLKNGFRGRHPSECSLDSEDSFVIFEDCPDSALGTSPCISIDHNSLEECGSEDDDSCSSSGSSDDEDDDDMENGEQVVKFDGASSNSRAKADCIWMRECCAQSVPEISKGVKRKAVHFAEGSNLVVVRPMVAWDFAYRESRRGPWEVHARDRARFQCRIASLAPILNAILDPVHRQRVESRLHDL
ncbi:uncharacterized protein LOC124153463 [Ischnura elegans]|uniref:uncharacterized protein LOC124153463 n=1 Tax=Ischnura elegans TaxID=197161 RepID=UPI001ED8A043|nr:uncharacterized protein LOC124153463 [Ischnura elegans]